MEKVIINIGRQLGAGGHDIAKRLAEEFGCKMYDKELLLLAAKESGFPEKLFEKNDEEKSFKKSWFHLPAPYGSDNNFYGNDISQEGLFRFQSDAIQKAAGEGNCVFVGRCADYILREDPAAVNVFVTADLDRRAEQVAGRRQCSREEALKFIRHAESCRSSYYHYFTGKRWGDSNSYDLCVNSSRLGWEATAQFIADFVRKRKHQSL